MSLRLFYGPHEYTDHEQVAALAAVLADDPEEPAGFVSASFKLMYQSFLMRDFKSPPLQMQRVCDVLAAVARLRGESYLK